MSSEFNTTTALPISTINQAAVTITAESCSLKYEDFSFPNDTLYCNWIFDSILCWPPTQAGESVFLRCPPTKGLDRNKFAERRCSREGKWESKPGTPESPLGWTNYTPCYLPEIYDLLQKLGDDVGDKIKIAERTRTLEIVGLSISLLALVISLLIFCRFRSLRNNRTKIHKNLFVAMVIQVLIRLILYIDQAIVRQSNEESNGIDNTAYLCEGSYILLEYARTAMFMWMFIEGFYLHNVVTVTVFQGRFLYSLYILIGWTVPIIMTAIWAGYTAIQKGNQKCWYGYNLTPYYWILEGPRMTVVILNFFFLLNIIRVLVLKLRQSNTGEIEQVKKGVRAALFLLPLLGITNFMNMINPLDQKFFDFRLWSYSTHFLTTFQGFFISLIYCFLNGEVRLAILKSISVYMSQRGHHDWTVQRPSIFCPNNPTIADTEQQVPPTLNGQTQNVNKQNKKSLGAHRIQSNWIRIFFSPRQMAMPMEQPESVVFDISD
ncbi:hypothetical protein PVAND_010463 [Polypedilum vanderplanki]|uniref:PDF receptor n=1 Tax=Polypedilum vanderplanki TaxID=319348 RepID=A0A9J6CGA6_POLVA|nr:hypothetical protein PVAND_010463 [Polypedilum vanderplanki]